MKHLLNLNEVVTVRLTPAGRKVWDQSPEGQNHPLWNDGTLNTQLWILFQVFGAQHYLGNLQMFDGNVIEIP